MPLPPSTSERVPVHGRTITLRGYRRSDGLWDIEGQLRDVRDHHFVFPGGERPGGEAIHTMWLRLTVDATALIIDAAAATDAAPFPGVCDGITPDYASGLIGLRVGPGFSRETARRFSGVRGCTHITEMAGMLATAAFQTMAGQRIQDPEKKPFQLDRCHALALDAPAVARYYPKWYTGAEKIEAAEEGDHH